MQPDDLERLVGRALHALPEPRAPRTFAPRVLEAARRANGRWYSRPWRTWPVGWQAAWAACLVALVTAGAVVAPQAGDAVAGLWQRLTVFSPELDQTLSVLRQAEATGSGIWVIWRLVFAPAMAYAAVVTVLMSLVCVGFAGAVTHFASRKAVSS
jgi:hypothetical protein